MGEVSAFPHASDGAPAMTEAEDAHNAELNELIRACKHEQIASHDGIVRCGKCPARFAIMLFPRRAKPHIFLENDDDV